MINKRLAAVLFAAVLFVSGCGKSEVIHTSEPDSQAVSISEADIIEETEKETAESESVELTGWEELKFTLDGESFAVPFSGTVISVYDWTLISLDDNYPVNLLLSAGEKTSNYYKICLKDRNQEARFLVGFVNNSDEDLAITDCNIWSVVFNIYDEDSKTVYENVPEVVLPEDITWGSSSEDILSAYGEPISTIEGEEDDYTVYTYMYDASKILKLTTRDEKGLVEIVILSYDKD